MCGTSVNILNGRRHRRSREHHRYSASGSHPPVRTQHPVAGRLLRTSSLAAGVGLLDPVQAEADRLPLLHRQRFTLGHRRRRADRRQVQSMVLGQDPPVRRNRIPGHSRRAGVRVHEGLAVVVACQLCKSSTHVGTRVSVRSESLSALTAVAQQKARAPGLGLIMAELAFTRAFDAVDFTELTHVPGAANGIADALSRLASSEPSSVPAVLEIVAWWLLYWMCVLLSYLGVAGAVGVNFVPPLPPFRI